MKRMNLFLLVVMTVLLVACGGAAPESSGPVTLRLMTHDSFDISQEVVEAFQAETGITLEIFKAGDGGELVNKAILSKDAPLADVLFGVDNTFLSRALDGDIFVSYESPELANVPDALELDSQHRALPVDYGDVCLNYDVAWFTEQGLEPPDDLDDLIDPRYAGLTVVQNAATSTPGLAFLLTTIERYGEPGYLDYWQGLVANDVLVVDGWSTAYREHFTAASDGARPIVVSYASSPAAEVYYAETPPAVAPTASVLGPGNCFRQVEFVGILQGTEYEAEARKLVDYMLGRQFQEDIPLHMFVYPVNETAQLPQVFVDHGAVATEPAQMDAAAISAGREAWIEAWVETVLR